MVSPKYFVICIPVLTFLIETALAPASGLISMLVGTMLVLAVVAGLVALQWLRDLPWSVACLIPAGIGLAYLLLFNPDPANYTIRQLHLAFLGMGPFWGITLFWLGRSGAWVYRKARITSQQIARKPDWPADLEEVRDTKLVKDFKKTVQIDITPAIELLNHGHAAVRIAALAAMEHRPYWRPGQIDPVLRMLDTEQVPEVRAGVLNAIASLKDRKASEALAQSLSDPDKSVRKAAAEGLFTPRDRKTGSGHRWQHMRAGVRQALSVQHYGEPASILLDGQLLPRDAIDDIVNWVGERGVIGTRSAETLAVHYSRQYRESPEETTKEIQKLVAVPNAPSLLRVHLVRLLSTYRNVDLMMMEKLLDPSNPAPIRQLAAETLLNRAGRHPNAISTLREIALLNNREIALDTARILQNCLNVDMGLALGQPLPHPASPRAAEITRRVAMWASRSDFDNALDTGYQHHL